MAGPSDREPGDPETLEPWTHFVPVRGAASFAGLSADAAEPEWTEEFEPEPWPLAVPR